MKELEVKQQLLRRLRTHTPYPDEPPEIPVDVFGWAGNMEKLEALYPDPEVVVEVGGWAGKGTLEMLEIWPRATIITIDHWRGGPEHQLGEEHHHEKLTIMWEQWLRNIWPHRHRVIPMKCESHLMLHRIGEEIRDLPDAEAWMRLVDLIYIDGGHEERTVYADLVEADWVRPRCICGDDYEVVKAPNGVRRAVENYAANTSSLKVHHWERFWWFEGGRYPAGIRS